MENISRLSPKSKLQSSVRWHSVQAFSPTKTPTLHPTTRGKTVSFSNVGDHDEQFHWSRATFACFVNPEDEEEEKARNICNAKPSARASVRVRAYAHGLTLGVENVRQKYHPPLRRRYWSFLQREQIYQTRWIFNFLNWNSPRWIGSRGDDGHGRRLSIWFFLNVFRWLNLWRNHV